MTLCDTVFTRRSVRKYDKEPLNEDVLKNISDYLDRLENAGQMTGQKANFEIVGTDKVRGPSPHYILAYCGKNDSAYANVGYVLQKMDLYIQSLGFGSLYLGVKKPRDASDDFCILLAFGRTSVPSGKVKKNSADFRSARCPLQTTWPRALQELPRPQGTHSHGN